MSRIKIILLGFGLWFWIKLIRSWKSPLLYWIFRFTKYLGRELPDVWDKAKDLEMNEFHRMIELHSKYDYLSDMLGGFLDFSPKEKNFFFLERETSRDCDNWARMWFWWSKYHDYPTWEIAISDTDKPIEREGLRITVRSHMLTVSEIEGKYYLFDYHPVGSFSSIKEALNNNIVGFDNFVWVVNKRG